MTRLPERPEVIFLDLGDTLARAHPSWAAVYETVLREYGLPVPDEDAFRTAWRAVFVEDAVGPFEATAEASFRRLKDIDGRIFTRLGIEYLPDEFFRAIERAFNVRSAWFVFDDVVPALDALMAAGLRLAVISNWSWAAPELVHDLQLARHFEALVISARVGYQKPSPHIFRHALALMRVDPDGAIHVGDSVHADVGGARGVGIAPVLVVRGASEAASRAELAAAHQVPVIGDLFGLLDLLGIERPAHARVS